MNRRLPLLLAAALTCRLLAAGPVSAQAPAQTPAPAPPKAVFSFYGLRFGMTKDEVTLAFRTFDGQRVHSPGHGMDALEIAFDREGTVMEFRAIYLKPGDPLELVGLQRALREKWLVPMGVAFPDIGVSLDDYGNRAAIAVVFLSSGIRERNIEHYKKGYLKSFE